MLKRVLSLALPVVLIAAFGSWYFRSSTTRLTAVPSSDAVRTTSLGAGRTRLPHAPRSVVVVVEENKSFEQFASGDDAPYLQSLARTGALFTHAYGIAHPSQPNYFALFSGQTNRNGDGCPAHGVAKNAGNLAGELLAKQRSFRAYEEDLPYAGFAGCTSRKYARKHAPWTAFANVPARDAVPFSALRSYDTLPDVAFVIPDLDHDMHDGSIARGDAWARAHLAPLIAWARTHDTLVVITWDESSAPLSNHIPTLFVGPMVRPGRYGEVISHDRVLRTIEDLFGLAHAGSSATAQPIVDCWKPTGTRTEAMIRSGSLH